MVCPLRIEFTKPIYNVTSWCNTQFYIFFDPHIDDISFFFFFPVKRTTKETFAFDAFIIVFFRNIFSKYIYFLR